MSHRSALGRGRTIIVVTSIAAVALAGLAGSTSYAAGSGTPSAHAPRASVEHDARGYYDVRTSGQQARTASLRTAHRVAAKPQVRAFQRAASGQTVTDIDGNTGTVRVRTRLDGFLTPRSKKTAVHITLGYVKAHLADLGLAPGDLKTFHLARNYRDITGAHHLYFTQRIGGQQVIGDGLTATVNKAGHLLAVGGSPHSKATTTLAGPVSSAKLATPGAALAAARGATVAGADTSADGVTRGLFVVNGVAHPAWQAIVMSARTPAMVVLDAQTGDVLQRSPLVNYESGDNTGKVFHFFPGARKGGKQVRVNFTKRHWLPRSARVLRGNNSHAYSDVNDNDRSSKTEEVRARHPHSWSYRLRPFRLGFAKSFCGNPWPCSWNPNKAFSWRVNRAQNATQVFFFVNNWHDHLLRAPIGFTEAAGNFEAVNRGKAGKDGDSVTTQTDDGANTAGGFPDGNHIDNANMSTPPDGRNPRMQMYLQHQPFSAYPDEDPFSPTNVGDEADTVYHEYTHGLSNRLNVDVQGRSTLGGVQAGAMGEAWSDWYAMDYLVNQRLQRDRAAKADVRLFIYDGEGVNYDRTEPIDCRVGQKVRLCNGGATGHRGGYTYRDYGHVIGQPEVHSDGEIWAQTLWSLRRAVGPKRTESLVTRAMEMAPYNPSFLDMRNAILVADTSLYHGRQRAAIWRVFASRGMGFYAGSLGGGDSKPGWSFATPPAAGLATKTVQGTVTDANIAGPDKGVAGVTVTLAFQGSGVANPTDVTDADGHYAIPGVPQGSYTKLQVLGAGYSAQKAVTVGPAGATVDFAVHKDLATRAAGASIDSTNGLVFQGCAPQQAVDQNQATGWSTNIDEGAGDLSDTFVPKNMVVALGGTYDVTSFGIDPSAACGDGGSAATAGYQVETSPDGATWTDAHTGTFTNADDGRINEIASNDGATGVQFVRITLTSNQTPDFATNCPNGGYSGCQYVDLTEFQVYGTPAP